MTTNTDEPVFETESLAKKRNVPEEIAVNEAGSLLGTAITRPCPSDGTNEMNSSDSQKSSNDASFFESFDDANVVAFPRHRGIPPSSAVIPMKSPVFSGEKLKNVTTNAAQSVEVTAYDFVTIGEVPQGCATSLTARAEQSLKPNSIVQPTPSKMRSKFCLPTMSKPNSSSDSTARPRTGVEAKRPPEPCSKVIAFAANGTAISNEKSIHEASEKFHKSKPKPMNNPNVITKEANVIANELRDMHETKQWPCQPTLNQASISDRTNTPLNISAKKVANENIVQSILDCRDDRKIEKYLDTTNEDGSRITTNGSQGLSIGKCPTTAQSVKADKDEKKSGDGFRAARRRHDHLKQKARTLRPIGCYKEGLEVAENDKLLQPLAQMIDDYYLVGDETLVEEDWPSAYPVRHVSEVMAKQTNLPEAMSLMIHQIPPRIVGGLQDRMHVKKIACSCKVKIGNPGSRDACLKLDCDCFAIGEYCNGNCKCCASCFNSASESNVQPRTDAIIEALRKDPSAFRHAHTKIAQLQKDRRVQLLKSDTKPTKNQHQSLFKRLQKEYPPKFSAASQVEMITTQLQPSYYAVPLKVDDGSTVLTGLSFSLTHPRNRKNDQNTKTPKTPAVAKQIVSTSAHAKSIEVVETQFQKYWKLETERMSAFFQVMRAQENTSQKPWSWLPFEQTQKEASTSYARINNDIECVKAVVTAAKIDIMARFYKRSRHKRGYAPDSMDVSYPNTCKRGKSSNPEDDQMLCYEEMERIEERAPSVGESEIKEMTIFVAQDTALLQETSRIVRRMARELCERRMNSNQL